MKLQRRERLMRFVRLVLACVAFVLARPTTNISAFDAADRIVLVAGASEKAREESGPKTKPRASQQQQQQQQQFRQSLGALERERFLASSSSSSALAATSIALDREALYLHHCSLLC